MKVKYAHLNPDLLHFHLDSSFGNAKKCQILDDIKRNGVRNPISVKYVRRPDVQNGAYLVTWGASRAWACKALDIPVPAVIFDESGEAEGEEIDDPRVLFDCPVNYKPHKALIAPSDNFWN